MEAPMPMTTSEITDVPRQRRNDSRPGARRACTGSAESVSEDLPGARAGLADYELTRCRLRAGYRGLARGPGMRGIYHRHQPVTADDHYLQPARPSNGLPQIRRRHAGPAPGPAPSLSWPPPRPGSLPATRGAARRAG